MSIGYQIEGQASLYLISVRVVVIDRYSANAIAPSSVISFSTRLYCAEWMQALRQVWTLNLDLLPHYLERFCFFQPREHTNDP